MFYVECPYITDRLAGVEWGGVGWGGVGSGRDGDGVG